MSSNFIHSTFRTVADKTAARAFSEPFTFESDFGQKTLDGEPIPEMGPENVAAICSSFIDHEAVRHDFFLNPAQPDRTSAANSFIESYGLLVCDEKAKAEQEAAILGQSAANRWIIASLECIKGRRLTIGAMAVFRKPSAGYSAAFMAPQEIIKDLPFRRREVFLDRIKSQPGGIDIVHKIVGEMGFHDEDQIDQAIQDITQNRNQTEFGFYVASLSMPDLPELKRLVDLARAVNEPSSY